MTDYQTINYQENDGLATLVLNRPDKLNSFNSLMHDEVKQVMAHLKSSDSVRCLLLTANGRGFCAGQDLSDRAVNSDADAAPDLAWSLENNYNPFIRGLNALPFPVICAVNGVAAGAGANIALACDLVIAAQSASFVQSFNRLGLVPDSGGTWVLPRLVGHAQAMALCLLGDKVPAQQAQQMGMIWKVLPDDEYLSFAQQLGQQLAKAPTKGLAYIKQALYASSTNMLDQQLDLERDLQGLAGKSEDYREGVQAFMQKRQPNYIGK